MKKQLITLTISLLFSTGCFIHSEQQKVLINNIDINQSLLVARDELKQNKFSTVLGIWALRDQKLNSNQAKTVSLLYFEHINRIDSENQKSRSFSVWHLTWAISNMYRLGDNEVKAELQHAYDDAEKRVKNLDRRVATKHFHDDKLTMGDIHFGGRGYAKRHIVAPGNDKYLQSYQEYLDNQKD